MSSENMAASTTAALVVGSGVINSLQHTQSLLNSTLSDIMAGHFTLYFSDIVSVGGLIIGFVSLAIAIVRLTRGK